ncbi:MAG: hypothetical protein F4213_21625 [Boseongicola sp. SB0677_bin_26]|nr:hypothetical protein [Boseongicola sp. SB0665_bin_10]MYG28581.1 hypothetical protein [Boseongicola sp. SB0677_bin_26]
MSSTDRKWAKQPALAKVAIIGAASVNGYFIGTKMSGFSLLWMTLALLLNWAVLSVASILVERRGDQK